MENENKEDFDYQTEYLKLVNENKSLKERNEELFKVIVSFNGQKPLVSQESEQKSEEKKIVKLSDLKF